MKALVVDAEWKPRKGYPLSEIEEKEKRAFVGNQVWCNPRFEVKDVPTPNIADEEVLIRMVSCGICGTDTHLYETDEDGYIIYSGPVKLPCVLGHEFSGIVEKTGKNVSTLKVGDKVASESISWCGMCNQCRSGFPNQCENINLIGLSADGAFAEYIKVNARLCWKIDSLANIYAEEDIFDIGSLIEPVGCAYNGMFIAGGGFRPGAAVVVFGVGPIGLGAIALAKITGASLIAAFDIIDERLEISKQMGADYAFNVCKMDGLKPSIKILELTDGRGAEILIEAAGAAPLTIPEMEKCMSVSGKIIYLGRVATTTPVYLDNLVSTASSIVGARGHAGYGIFPFIIKLLACGKLDLRNMITARYPFSKVMEAIKRATDRTDGKIIIRGGS